MLGGASHPFYLSLIKCHLTPGYVSALFLAVLHLAHGLAALGFDHAQHVALHTSSRILQHLYLVVILRKVKGNGIWDDC